MFPYANEQTGCDASGAGPLSVALPYANEEKGLNFCWVNERDAVTWTWLQHQKRKPARKTKVVWDPKWIICEWILACLGWRRRRRRRVLNDALSWLINVNRLSRRFLVSLTFRRLGVWEAAENVAKSNGSSFVSWWRHRWRHRWPRWFFVPFGWYGNVAAGLIWSSGGVLLYYWPAR